MGIETQFSANGCGPLWLVQLWAQAYFPDKAAREPLTP